MTLAPLPVEGAEVWPTTRFKVFAGNPFIGDTMIGTDQIDDLVGLDWFEFEDRIGAPDKATIREIERALGEAAQWYKRKGFPPPLLEPIIDTDDGPAYQVYVCSKELDLTIKYAVLDFLGQGDLNLVQSVWNQCGYDRKKDKTVAGLYYTPCGDNSTRTKIIIINSDKSLDDNNKLTELGYQTIAHELMHAIVANTPLGQSKSNCKMTKWITEGLPDAISFDIAEDEWVGRYRPGIENKEVTKRWGYRPYFDRLPHPLATYTTSSFWRYIADSHLDGWGVLLTRDKPGAAPGLLDIPMPGGRGWRHEVNWLDKGLRGKFNLGLDDMYGLFVNNFAYRIAPMKDFAKPPTKENHEYWVERLFGQCAKVGLKTASSQEVTLELKGLASACIWVEPTNAPGFIQITFQAGSDDLTLLEDIRIGRTGTALVVRANPIAYTPHADTQYLASWRDMPQDGSKRTLYVVSNIANVAVRRPIQIHRLWAAYDDQLKPGAWYLRLSGAVHHRRWRRSPNAWRNSGHGTNQHT